MIIAYRTDKGAQRQNNQDAVGAYYNQNNIPLMLVADGVASNPGSQQASQLVIHFLGEAWQLTTLTLLDEIKDWLDKTIAQANETVIEVGQNHQATANMATTIVLAVVVGNQLLVANAGDSKAYYVRDQRLTQLSFDHTLRNELARQDGKDYDAKLPEANSITRYVGVNNQIDLEYHQHQLEKNDIIFLTSDGLPKALTDHEMAAIISSNQPLQERVDELIDEANRRDASDNITALIAMSDQAASDRKD
ncbi:PP2C family protein-serine/threonine phosphatase [Eupransor demetentiae]|uniref:Serine/threonine protein phosphatase PrpC (PTC1) n=1 Tax=Eupransor demetentiae TaxID=3109584 RepID=A0ABM9N4X1_9LACO|nr:Serine/threonine protein phosphatase PrpC (PTC1) [Lactobacillaceae bacterium LMG 33000]